MHKDMHTDMPMFLPSIYQFFGEITRLHVAFLAGVNNISSKWEWVQQWQGDKGM
jgi:hypothetical protein